MINEELIYRAHGMLLDRYNYFKKQEAKSRSDEKKEFNFMVGGAADAYKSAYDILWYAINGDKKRLKEFDYYAD